MRKLILKIYYIRPSGDNLYERALKEVYATNNRKAIRIITTACTMLLCCSSIYAKANNPVEELGYSAIDMIQVILTIIAILMAFFEIGKAFIEGDPKRIPSIVAKYGIGVICVFAIPGVFLKIKEAFDGWWY